MKGPGEVFATRDVVSPRRTRQLSFDDRARVMRRTLQILLDRQEEVIDVVVREMGKTHSEALMMEVYAVCDSLNYHVKNTAKILKPEKKRWPWPAPSGSFPARSSSAAKTP